MTRSFQIQPNWRRYETGLYPLLSEIFSSFSVYATIITNISIFFAFLAYPLLDLLRKGQVWHLSTIKQSVFNSLKTLLTNPPVLYILLLHEPFIVYSDILNICIGAVLKQCGQPVIFFSCILNTLSITIQLPTVNCLQQFQPTITGIVIYMILAQQWFLPITNPQFNFLVSQC